MKQPDLVQAPFAMLESPTDAGVVAIGGKVTPHLLRQSYPQGIFPWPHDDMPLLWFCPDPRFVLFPKEVHVPRSLLKNMRRRPFQLKMDTRFGDVMRGCQDAAREGQAGTWITDDMIRAYSVLFEEGRAHSVEVYDKNNDLVGGFYGISDGDVFFGESMFALENDASKIAFATAVAQLDKWGYRLIDCQSYTDHLARFGAYEIDRSEFLALLQQNRDGAERIGKWTLEIDSAEAATHLKTLLRDSANGQADHALLSTEEPPES